MQSMFTEVMLKAMEDSIDAEDGLFGGSASSDIYRGMLNDQLSSAMSAQMKSPLVQTLDTALSKRSSAVSSEKAEPAVQQEPSLELPVAGVISSPKGWRRDPINGQTRYHDGTDIAAPAGTPILAVAGGRV